MHAHSAKLKILHYEFIFNLKSFDSIKIKSRAKAFISWISNLPTEKSVLIFRSQSDSKPKNKRFKISEQNELIRVAGQVQLSERMYEVFQKWTKKHRKNLLKLQEMLQNLAKLRNSILNHLHYIQEDAHKKIIREVYTK